MSGLRRMHNYQLLLRLKNGDLQCRHRRPLSSFDWWSNQQHTSRHAATGHHHHAATPCGDTSWGVTTTATAAYSNVTIAKSPLHLPRNCYNSTILQRCCCFSTTTTSNKNNNKMNMAAAAVLTRKSQNKLVLGSHKWSSMDASHYCEIVHTALLNGVSTIEAGQGAGALQALHTCLLQLQQQPPSQESSLEQQPDDDAIAAQEQQQRPAATIRILQRVGYRTTLRLPPPPPPPPPTTDDDEEDHYVGTTIEAADKQQQEQAAAETTFALLPGDVIVEEVPVSAEDASSACVKPVPGAPRSKPSTAATKSIPPPGTTTVVLHNISAAGIQEAMSTSPFSTTPLTHQNKVVETVLMLHNPEVQGGAIRQDDGGSSTKRSGLILPSATSLTTDKAAPSSPRQDAICAQLVESFVALERAVQSGHIASYGIVSNGLGLPASHPLHLSWYGSIRPALERAFQILNAPTKSNGDDDNNNNDIDAQPQRQLLHFSILELPVNLIETTGLQVARQVQQDLQQDDEFRNKFANNNDSSSNSKSPIEIFAMRPLSAYPDLGTGQDGHSLVLADYLLPTLATSTTSSMNEMATGEGATKSTTASESDSNPQSPPPPPPRMQWSHTMSSPPDIYNVALQSAMAHFDAEAILEAQQERLAQGEKADLTAEERETLDGCKLMQSLLHDVDVGLDKMRSFAVHERELTQRIIPLIYDTFEEYDDDTAKVLQTFFAAYSLAVRYAIAKNTRQLLLHGENLSLAASSNASNIPIFKDLHPDIKLQEYAIGFLLKQQLETLPKRQETNIDSNVDGAVASGDGAEKTAQSEARTFSKDVIDKIVVGCADPDQVIDDLELVYQFYARKVQDEQQQAAKELAETRKA